MRIRAFLLLAMVAAWGELQAAPGTEILKFLISVEQQTLTLPYALRATLHLHNSGQAAVWLYRPVREPTGNGSALEVRLAPADEAAAATPGRGVVFERAGFPRPRLVRIDPGDDYEEKTTLKIVPARAGTNGEGEAVWGRYRLTAVYSARYSNAATLERILGVDLWEGEVTSNTVEIEVQPPAGKGRISGRVRTKESQSLIGAVVSLSDEQERLVDQTRTDLEGQYEFQKLPWGVYWVVVRRRDYPEDTVQFRHIGLDEQEPEGAMDFLILPREIYEARELLHKPVLFRITDREGRPLDKVRLEIVWSSGRVLESIKEDVADDGTAALQLLPGRNYVTLKRSGCRKQEQRVDVAEGDGIDGFILHYDCSAE
ncbi:MAG TPA: carboxypeptidase-like regulatory domain-containing protein [Terriglobia bacterium]|nr:carboxypeptidase-like regulatory domain-containing protein [Terriglobia bacterium]